LRLIDSSNICQTPIMQKDPYFIGFVHLLLPGTVKTYFLNM